MKEKRLHTEYGNIFYWCSESWSEDKKVLFFLHGMTANHSMFQAQYNHFKNHYNIVLWDAPAHGKSRPFREFNYEIAAEGIHMLFENEKIEQAVFIGQSMGGFITQAVIKRHPDLVSAFVSIDSCPYGMQYYSKSDIWWLKQVEWMSRLFPLSMLKKASAKQNTVTAAGYDNMISMLEPYGKNELCHLMGVGYAAFIEDNTDLEIRCPTLLIVGEQDKTGKVIQYNKLWNKATGFPLIMIEGAAHNSNVDQPQKVNTAIEKFIENRNLCGSVNSKTDQNFIGQYRK